MFKLIANYPGAFVLAIIFHIIAAGAFVVSLQSDPEPVAGAKPVDVVQATMVNEKDVQLELAKLRALEEKKRQAEADRIKALEREAEAAREKRLKEQTRLKELEGKREEALAKKQQLDKERKIAQQKLKEEDRKRKVAETKRREAEKAAKQAEQKRLKEVRRQKKAEVERKRVEEKARKAKEAQRLQRAEEQRERQRQIEEENQRLQNERAKKANKVISRYKGLIQKQVENNWRKPATAKSHMSCDVYVRMMPTGDVLKVEARKCVGNDLFKRSVEDAVRAAAPLPLPPNKSLFTHFREITFKFKPSN